MYSILPKDYIIRTREKGNKLIIDNDNDKIPDKNGKYVISVSSGVSTVKNLLDKSDNYWTSQSNFTSKYDDLKTSTTVQDLTNEICSGDAYTEGSCITRYQGSKHVKSLIKYINLDGLEVTMNLRVFGEIIAFKFPTDFYIFETRITFAEDRSKPYDYYILGKNKNKPYWQLINQHLGISYDKTTDNLPINKIDKFDKIIVIFGSGREENYITIKNIEIMGSTSLEDSPLKIYNGFKEYFTNNDNNMNIKEKKHVRFSDQNDVRIIEPLHLMNNNYTYYKHTLLDYLPSILILGALGYSIIKKK